MKYLLIPLLVLDVYLVVALAYFYVLYFVSRFGRKPGLSPQAAEPKSFGILIPAHNEEKVIGNLLSRLESLVYPRDLFRVYVVADNCTDGTAEIARKYPVNVLERNDDLNRGKGFAISWALENSDILRHDAIVFIDADCIPDGNILQVMSGCLSDETPVVQAYNGSFEPDIENPIAVLLYIGNIMENKYFWYPKSLLRDSAIFLQGTGMAFTRGILQRYKWNSFSIVEDLEYSVSMLLAGERIGYTMDTSVSTYEPSSGRGVSSQKLRSASGVVGTIGKYLVPMASKGIACRKRRLIDGALSLLLLNKNFIAGVAILSVLLSLLANDPAVIAINIALFALLAFYVLAVIVGTVGSARAFRLMLSIPPYFAWMMGINLLALFGYKRKAWVKTER